MNNDTQDKLYRERAKFDTMGYAYCLLAKEFARVAKVEDIECGSPIRALIPIANYFASEMFKSYDNIIRIDAGLDPINDTSMI